MHMGLGGKKQELGQSSQGDDLQSSEGLCRHCRTSLWLSFRVKWGSWQGSEERSAMTLLAFLRVSSGPCVENKRWGLARVGLPPRAGNIRSGQRGLGSVDQWRHWPQ